MEPEALKCTSMYLPNREELSFLTVLALPKAEISFLEKKME